MGDCDCDCDCGDCDCGDCDCGDCDCGHCCDGDGCCKDCPFCCNICTAFTCANCCAECCEDAWCDVCYASSTSRTDYREQQNGQRRRQVQDEFREPVPSYGGVDKEMGFPDGPPPSYNEVVFTQPGDANGDSPGYGTGVITSQPGSAVGAPNTSI